MRASVLIVLCALCSCAGPVVNDGEIGVEYHQGVAYAYMSASGEYGAVRATPAAVMAWTDEWAQFDAEFTIELKQLLRAGVTVECFFQRDDPICEICVDIVGTPRHCFLLPRAAPQASKP